MPENIDISITLQSVVQAIESLKTTNKDLTLSFIQAIESLKITNKNLALQAIEPLKKEKIRESKRYKVDKREQDYEKQMINISKVRSKMMFDDIESMSKKLITPISIEAIKSPIALRGLYKQAESIIKEYIEQGGNINELAKDEEELLYLRLQTLEEYTDRFKISEEKLDKAKEGLIQEFINEKKLMEERQLKSRMAMFTYEKYRGEEAVKAITKKVAKSPTELLETKFKTAPAVFEAFPELIKEAEDMIRQYIAEGEDINWLLHDEEDILSFRIKVLEKYANKEDMDEETLSSLRDSLIKEFDAEIKRKKRTEFIQNKLDDAYESAIGSFMSIAEKIPFLGKSLSKAIEAWSLQKDKEGKTRKERVIEGLSKKIVGGGLEGKFGELLKIAIKLSPLLIIIGGTLALIVSKIIEAVGQFLNLNSEIVKSTGFTSKLGESLHNSITRAQKKLMDSGGFIDALKETRELTLQMAGALSSEFGNIAALSDKMITLTASLAKRLGISAQEAASFTKIFNRGLGLSVEQTTSLLKNIRLSSEVAGVSFNDAIKEVANSWEDIIAFIGKSEKAITKAIIKAKELGTTISEQTKTARQFMTYEQAAQNAFTLQVLTGKKLSAIQLFHQANYGDAIGMQNKLLGISAKLILNEKEMLYRRELAARTLGLSLGEAIKLLNASAEQVKIEKELNKILGKNFVKSEQYKENIDYYKSALKTLRIELGPKAEIGAEALRERAEKIKAARAKGERELIEITEILGLKELMSPTETIQALIAARIGKIAMWIADRIGPAIMKILDIIEGTFGESEKSKQKRREKTIDYLKLREPLIEKRMKEEKIPTEKVSFAPRKFMPESDIKKMEYFSIKLEDISTEEFESPRFKKFFKKFNVGALKKQREYNLAYNKIIEDFQIKMTHAEGDKEKNEIEMQSALAKINLDKRFGFTSKMLGEERKKLHPKEKEVFQLGGVTKGSSIVGEAGPELILPLTGPGVNLTTEKASRSIGEVVSENVTDKYNEIINSLKYVKDVPKKEVKDENKLQNEKIDELIASINNLLNSRSTLKVPVYLDSRKIAEGIVNQSLLIP